MSTESVQDIIGKAVVDSEYRELLFVEPDKALEGYELTEEEIVSLKGIKAEKFDELLTDIEERISKAGINFNLLEAVGSFQANLSFDDFEP